MSSARTGLAAVSLLSLALVGCGGGGHHSSSSRATLRMNVEWPERNARFVPNASNSVVAVVTIKGKEVARTLIVRPNASRSPIASASTTIDLERLPVGAATVTMTAYPEADGTGIAQSAGSETVRLAKGQTTTESASLMASTIARLSLAPDPSRTNASTTSLDLAANESARLVVTAYDAQNRMVLIQKNSYAEDMAWTSGAAATATVDPEGMVTGVAVGATHVDLAMNVGGAASVTASFPVNVAVARTLVSISMTPDQDFTVTTHDDIQLHVYAHYSDNTQEEVTSQCSWNIYGGATAVTSSGLLKWTPGTSTSYIEIEGSYLGQSTGYLDISYGS